LKGKSNINSKNHIWSISTGEKRTLLISYACLCF